MVLDPRARSSPWRIAIVGPSDEAEQHDSDPSWGAVWFCLAVWTSRCSEGTEISHCSCASSCALLGLGYARSNNCTNHNNADSVSKLSFLLHSLAIFSPRPVMRILLLLLPSRNGQLSDCRKQEIARKITGKKYMMQSYNLLLYLRFANDHCPRLFFFLPRRSRGSRPSSYWKWIAKHSWIFKYNTFFSITCCFPGFLVSCEPEAWSSSTRISVVEPSNEAQGLFGGHSPSGDQYWTAPWPSRNNDDSGISRSRCASPCAFSGIRHCRWSSRTGRSDNEIHSKPSEIAILLCLFDSIPARCK